MSRTGCGIQLYRSLIIAFLSTFCHALPEALTYFAFFYILCYNYYYFNSVNQEESLVLCAAIKTEKHNQPNMTSDPLSPVKRICLFERIPSWQILTAHAQPFRGARDLAFCLKVPLDSMLVWASSGVSSLLAKAISIKFAWRGLIEDWVWMSVYGHQILPRDSLFQNSLITF